MLEIQQVCHSQATSDSYRYNISICLSKNYSKNDTSDATLVFPGWTLWLFPVSWEAIPLYSIYFPVPSVLVKAYVFAQGDRSDTSSCLIQTITNLLVQLPETKHKANTWRLNFKGNFTSSFVLNDLILQVVVIMLST